MKNIVIFLAIMLLCCSCSTPESADDKGDSEAARWLRIAAEDGVIYAQYYYAECALEGDGTRADAVEAVNHLRSAAASGCAQAMFLLGKCYRNGTGVEASAAEAEKWFARAAEKGNPDAKAALKALREAGKK